MQEQAALTTLQVAMDLDQLNDTDVLVIAHRFISQTLYKKELFPLGS